MHGLLDREQAAIVKAAQDRGEIDRSHRKPAHRTSRPDVVQLSESGVLRVPVDGRWDHHRSGRRWPRWRWSLG